ncbi:hypothetical protein Q4543_07970 [Salipiger sp. 1_MG-2023]|uniref:hypothetical protein n=1 Tax=Salipiger sp. 1_MG-2023 TaxID=3062665 RepID=UPI0026E28CA4|nr:hypothetical protein [Salipiger sp. 1_MG-2023]MDO6585452.1 hypothetical protein [Salipiger sp. 1_MG-2023]
MSIELTLYPRRNLAYLRFAGIATPSEYISVVERLQGAGEVHPGTAILADLSRVEDMVLDFLQTLSMVGVESRLCSRVLPGTRYACYAPDDLAYGASRMYHQIADNALPYQMDVFRLEGPALEYIEQPERTIAEFLRAAR